MRRLLPKKYLQYTNKKAKEKTNQFSKIGTDIKNQRRHYQQKQATQKHQQIPNKQTTKERKNKKNKKNI